MPSRWALFGCAITLLIVTGCSARPAPAPVSPAPAPATGTGNGGPGNPGTGENTPNPLTAADEKLGGLKLGMTDTEVSAALGAPTKRRPGHGIEIWEYPKGLLAYMDPTSHILFGIRVEKDWNGETPRHLLLGDTEARLRQLYGDPNYKGKNIWLASSHAYADPATNLGIAFDVNAGKVTGIQVLRLPPDKPAGN